MTDQTPDAGPPFNPYILFGEGLSVYKFAGGGIILSAIYIAASSENREAKAEKLP
jgi:drug/metabolite transporter (DMT)-like permease